MIIWGLNLAVLLSLLPKKLYSYRRIEKGFQSSAITITPRVRFSRPVLSTMPRLRKRRQVPDDL